MEEQNEFGTPENDVQQDFSGVNIEPTEEEVSGNDMMDQSNLVAPSNAGVVYDWTQAPEGTKAPPREDLNGKEVIIEKADLILPMENIPWQKTKDGQKEFKPVKFELTYNVNGQRETYSGARTFKRDVDGKAMLSPPTIYANGSSQAAMLMKRYAEYKGKNIAEVSLREFMAFLNGKPKAVIKTLDVTNPQTHATVTKNLVYKFI